MQEGQVDEGDSGAALQQRCLGREIKGVLFLVECTEIISPGSFTILILMLHVMIQPFFGRFFKGWLTAELI